MSLITWLKMNWSEGVVASCVGLMLLGCQPAPDPFRQVQHLPLNTSVPCLTLGPDGEPILCYVRSDSGTHRLEHRAWNGQQWGEVRSIAEDSLMLVNWADRPQLAFGPNGTAFAHWLRIDERGDFAYSIQASRSQDQGKSWSAPEQPHQDSSIAEHGFAQWMPFEGGAALAWLDGRDFDGHSDPGSARMEVRSATWLNGEPWSEEIVLDSSACTCCPMATLPLGSSQYELVYRDRLQGEIRDFNRIEIDARSQEFRNLGALHTDGWEIAACPVNGASMCQNSERVLAVWYTAAQDEARIKMAWRMKGEKGEAAFQEPLELHQNPPLGRITCATDDQGHFYAIWLETNATGGVDWMGHHWDAHGTPINPTPVPLIPASERRAGGFPTAMGIEQGVLVAWTNPFPSPHVMTAVWTPH